MRFQSSLSFLLVALAGCGGRVASEAHPAEDADSAPSDSLDDSDVGETQDATALSTPRSCESGRAGAGNNCGVGHSDDCCASPPVPGGTFLRGFNHEVSPPKDYPATLGDFWLDRYEVTVGRFRAFVEAYPGSRPQLGDGAHSSIPGSGWRDDWPIPATQADLRAQLAAGATNSLCGKGGASWTDQPGPNERKPMNCVTWQLLFAFCAWDRGQMPTDAQLDYAMTGGSDQRYYPWSSPPTSTSIDDSRAVYSTDFQHPRQWAEDVGSRPSGAGRWGQLDLAGNIHEWAMDGSSSYSAPQVPCVDCGSVGPVGDMTRLSRGGSFWDEPGNLPSTAVADSWSAEVDPWSGARCSRMSAP